MNKEDRRKIAFLLVKDEEGYPPADVEWVWAKPAGWWDVFEIDNIPFFVKCLALGDKVIAKKNADGNLQYQRHKSYSGHSTLRVLFSDESDVSQTRTALASLGCSSELSHLPRLIAVDIPREVDIKKATDFLKEGEASGRWEIEEGCVWDDPKSQSAKATS